MIDLTGWFGSPKTTLVLLGIIVALFLFKPEVRKILSWLKHMNDRKE